MTEPRVYGPEGWGAQVNYDLWNDTWYDKDKVIVHYGGNATFAGAPEPAAEKGFAYPSFGVESAVLRIYEQSHLSRGWRGLAYGWAVGQTGNVYRIRGWNTYGAHRGDLEDDGIPENREGIPILAILGGAQEPSAEMLQSIDWLVFTLGMTKGTVYPVFGHQEIAELGTGGTATACPGVPLMEWIDERRTAPVVPPETGDGELTITELVTDETWQALWDGGCIDGDPAVMPDYYFADGPASDSEKINGYNVAIQSFVAKLNDCVDVELVDQVNALEASLDDTQEKLRSV